MTAAGSLVLALETSCDESAVALWAPTTGLRGEWVASQVDLHAVYGGVVPELASRAHLEALPPLLAEAWRVAAPGEVGTVAVTAGPGLAPCLALGLAAAKALIVAGVGRELVPVHHLRAHVWSPFLAVHAEDPAGYAERRDALLPHLGLVVSGGHTLLVRVARPAGGGEPELEVRAATGDDAAGEALDKGAKLLGLGYPGGPRVEREARAGDARAFAFPRALPGRGDRRFSFSGLKTALRLVVEALPEAERAARRPDLCASYQAAVCEQLRRKLREAAEEDAELRSLGLSGGVAANRVLRDELAELAGDLGVPLLAAAPAHTGDNAAMIAFAAWADPAARPLPPDEVEMRPEWAW